MYLLAIHDVVADSVVGILSWAFCRGHSVAGIQLRNSNSKRTMEVQIFGVRKSADTRKALRFFSERRIRTHFVDLNERAASLGELKKFAQKFGVGALIDSTSGVFQSLGLQHARMSDDSWLAKLVDEPLLLRMPLVRNGSQLTVGPAEVTWKKWMGK